MKERETGRPEGREHVAKAGTTPQVTVRIIRSKRKTIQFQVSSPEEVTVRAPLHMTQAEIRRLLEEKRAWIDAHLAAAARQEAERRAQPALTHEDIRELAGEARRMIPPRVAQRAVQIGVRYGRIAIRNQRTRWGSCSSKGNLNFNCMLMLCPDAVLDYVIVHELCHRKEMNHSSRFWAEVSSVLPDYREARKWLKENGPAVLARMP